jgi:hypothetical protein
MPATNRSVRRALAVLIAALPVVSLAVANEAPRFGLVATAELAGNEARSTSATTAPADGERFTLVATSVDVPLACGDDTIFENGFD